MSRNKWIPFWVIPVVVVLAIGTVWLRLSIIRTTYAINQSEKKARSLRQEREEMELKVTALRSPRRLEGIARTKFGLGTPRSDQVIHLGSRNAP
jgi:cell division protein FtsL